MNEQVINNIRLLARQFDENIKNALIEKHKIIQPQVKTIGIPELDSYEIMHLWNVENFVNNYVVNKIFPLERLNDVVYYLFDIVIQIYFIIEVDMGASNREIKYFNNENTSILSKHQKFIYFSFMQSKIIKSRILWERIMNLIYFLETGEDLEMSGKKSKKGKFFKNILEIDRWKFMKPYKELLERFDNEFRGPEVHKKSKIRKMILENEFNLMELNKVNVPLNEAINNIYPNFIRILSGNDNRIPIVYYGKERVE